MTTAEPLIAWHSDPKIKAKYVERMQEHRRLDHLIQAETWTPGNGGPPKGCAVGCLFESYDHSRGPIEIGHPEWLIRIEDAVFEGLPKVEAEQWAVDFVHAAPVGASWDRAWHRWALNLLDEDGPMREALKLATTNVRFAVAGVRDLHARASAGESIGKARCAAAREAASSACWTASSAARSAAWAASSAVKASAWDVEDAPWADRFAALAARSAAWAANRAAAWVARAAARDAAYREIAAFTLDIMRNLEVRK